MVQRHRWPIGMLMVLALAAAVSPLAGGGQASLANGTTIYVDADATGAKNGSTWDEAFTDLQAALTAAGSGTEIWVAAGIYTPTNGTDRFAAFQMKNGVAIYGGFDPSVGDIAFEDRDREANETILSGDLNGDDGPDFANNDENSYHVFYHSAGAGLDGTALLDGFTITGGNANSSSYPHDCGAGMYNSVSSPTLTNCTFRGNWANYGGGGMSNSSSQVVLTNCTFAGNWASAEGGGMYNYNYSSPTLTDCIFSKNSAIYTGGGMHNSRSSPTLASCTFEGNLTVGTGGGIHNRDNSAPMLSNCTFGGNIAHAGGGIYNNLGSSPAVINCTFADNVAVEHGGGMYNNFYSSPTLTNCIFEGNSAFEYGDGMYNYDNSSPTVTNCIYWDNGSWEISNDSSTPVITHSDIQGGCDAVSGANCGAGNINADPLFVDPGSGDFHLGSDSPCIDVGNNAAPWLPPFDFEGDARTVDGNGDGTVIVDMGVDEVLLRIYLPLLLRGY